MDIKHLFNSVYDQEHGLKAIYVRNNIDSGIEDKLSLLNTMSYNDCNIFDTSMFKTALKERDGFLLSKIFIADKLMEYNNFEKSQRESMNRFNIEDCYSLEMPVNYPFATSISALTTARDNKLVSLAYYRKELLELTTKIKFTPLNANKFSNEKHVYPADIVVSLSLLNDLMEKDKKLKIDTDIQLILKSEVFKFDKKGNIKFNPKFNKETLSEIDTQLRVHIWIVARSLNNNENALDFINKILPVSPLDTDTRCDIFKTMLGTWMHNNKLSELDKDWIKTNISDDEISNIKAMYNIDLKNKKASEIQFKTLSDCMDDTSLIINKLIGSAVIKKCVHAHAIVPSNIPLALYDNDLLTAMYNSLVGHAPPFAESIAKRLVAGDSRYANIPDLTGATWMSMLENKILSNNMSEVITPAIEFNSINTSIL